MNNTIYYICFEETDLLTEPRGEIDTKELSKCQWIPVDEILNKRVSLNKESHFTFKILLSKKILVFSKELENTTIETLDGGTLDGGTLEGGTLDGGTLDDSHYDSHKKETHDMMEISDDCVGLF
jgi:hypothetical protein